MYIACGFAIFSDIIIPIHCMYKIIPIELFLPQKEAVKVEFGISKSEIVDVSNDLYGWKELSAKINEVCDTYPKDKQPFLFTYKSYLASQIFFYTRFKIGILRNEILKVFITASSIKSHFTIRAD